MKLTGYDSFDFAPGYAVGLPDDWMPFPSVEPVTLPRTGTFPTFGPSEIGSLLIPGQVIILPENTIMIASGFEAAWMDFFKRLNPYLDEPRQLRCELNDGTKVTILAKVRILSRSGSRSVNERMVDFVAVEPFFETLTALTASGTF